MQRAALVASLTSVSIRMARSGSISMACGTRSTPLVPGMRISESINVTLCKRSCCSASSAEPAAYTSNCCCFRYFRSAFRIGSSSSTTGHAGIVTVLVVDDEEPIRNALRKYLKQQQFEVYAASSADEALQQLRLHKVALMLSDIRMPGTSGVDLVPQALEIEPDLAILMLTAVNDATSAALCMQRGAMDYLTKPIELADLGRAVQRALKRREMLAENRHLNQWLKEEVTTRTAELQRERMRMEGISTATLEALVNAMEAKDPYLRGHSARVADFSANIATEMGLDEEEVDRIRMAGRLHDLGKIGTREAVINKEGPLTADEFEHVKQHVIIGAQILAPLVHLGDVVAMVKSHHERFDGSGYPDGLRGEEVPLGGRVIAAAEVYDALTTARPYQEKMTPEQAVERMTDLSGTVLDPRVYEALVRLVGRRQTLVFLDEDAGPAL